jgi:hypothetical protein
MNLKSLRRITKHLRSAICELQDDDLRDRDIRHRYAEYLVARNLRENGFSVQLLNRREDRSADIYLPDANKKRVEVKSSYADSDGCWYASFGKGNQIEKNKFDYCVFVTFSKKSEEIFVFTKEELEEVTAIRKGLAAHEDTNPCLLMFAPTQKRFEKLVKEYGIKSFTIEKKLNRCRKKFRNAWHKIK